MNYIEKELGIKYLNELLRLKVRDFYSYNKIISSLLKIGKNIPIFITFDIIFLPIKSYKAYDCIWINYRMINSIINKNKTVLIKFSNGEIREFQVSYNKLNRIIKDAEIIITYFKKIECESVIK